MLKKLVVLSLALAGGCTTGGSGTAETNTVQPPAAIDQSELPPRKRPYSGPTKPPPEPDIEALSFGRGIAANDVMKFNFRFSVTVLETGAIEGWFEHSADLAAGTVDIEADVTCAVLDSPRQRAWIGGKVKRNGSTNPLYASAVGADVWFHAVGPVAETDPGAVGLPVMHDKKIASAAEFCKRKPWDKAALLTVQDGALGIFP